MAHGVNLRHFRRKRGDDPAVARQTPVMDIYYVFVIASRRHQHLSVGATASLRTGVNAHRARTNRRLGKARVFQKLVYVEAVRGVAEAVARQRELCRMSDRALGAVVASVNPAWEALSLRRLLQSGFDVNPVGNRDEGL